MSLISFVDFAVHFAGIHKDLRFKSTSDKKKVKKNLMPSHYFFLLIKSLEGS